MTVELVVELAIVGVAVGAMSGFFGVGGGMILVPILLALGLNIKDAIGISIMQMVFSSIYGSYLNQKKGTLIFGDGLYVGAGGFVGGFFGAWMTQFLSNDLLEVLFFGLLMFALFQLLFSKHRGDDAQTRNFHWGVLFVLGVVIGSFSITLGIGGSVVLTPILVGLMHYPIKKGVSAGLFFVVFSSVAGMISRLLTGTIDFEDGLIVAIASLIGVFWGIWLKDYVKSTHHKIALLVLYGISLVIIVNKMWF